ncbi:MAG: arylsulfatase [Acidimicrobiales bacterium]
MGQRALIGRTIADSTPHFGTRPPSAPAGSPNIVVIVLDDLGFGQLGCFGSDLATPAIDGLAADGLRYNRFHVTSLCSPTRACLLTGRNHHQVGMGFLTDIPVGFPGYDGRIPKTAAGLPRILRDNGYSTFAVGKWHLAPRWEQSASGPFERWPLGLGFERYYGFLAGDTNQWTPDLVRDNGFVDPPERPEDGYHLTEDLADQAIRFVQDQQQATPDKPFLLYFATGAMHAPHHAPLEWIERYRGAFDAGWDTWRDALFARQIELGVVPASTKLTPRPSWVNAWDEHTEDERRLFARQMEVYAGFLSHTDAQIGRVLGHLEEMGALDNTLVLLISDNGTSAEGGPVGTFNEHRFTHDIVDDLDDSIAHIEDLGGFRAYGHYSWGWAWAGNTPMRLWKRYSWLGGVRTPLIVRWPARVRARGETRDAFAHAVDLLPTILDAVGIEAPAVVDGVGQLPFDGASLVATFADPTVAGRSTQYFEMLGSRSIFHEGWKATTDHVGKQMAVERELLEGSTEFDDDRWLLFRLDDDFSESTDVAAEHPEVLRRLQELWWSEAGRNQVLPLDDTFIGRAVAMEPSPNVPRHRTTFRPGGGGIAEDLLPPMGAGFHLTASVAVPAEGAGGVLCALGDWSNGWAWYVLDGCMRATFNIFSAEHTTASTAGPITAGEHELRLSYQRRDVGGRVTLAVDDDVVGEGDVAHNLPFRWQIGGGGLLIGRDSGFPVSESYATPFPFTGTIHEVTVEIPMFAPKPPAADVAASLRHE